MEALAQRAATKFLRTAVFVDDQLEYSTATRAEGGLVDPSEPKAKAVETATEASKAPMAKRAVPAEAKSAQASPVVEAAAAEVEPTRATKAPITRKVAAADSAAAAASAPPENAVAEATDTSGESSGSLNVDVDGLINGFAKHRILCGTVNPTKENALSDNEIVGLCCAVDIVILDWSIKHDGGARTQTIIGKILANAKDADPHQNRLILVYTDHQNLQGVAVKIEEKLTELGFGPVRTHDQLRIKVGSSLIVVLGKKSAGKTATAAAADQITGADLPDRAIKEFSSLANGIVPSMVMAGLAAIRSNTGRIMATFSSKLDIGFLLHRALVLDTEDESEHHLRHILADELASALEEAWNDQALKNDVITNFCSGLDDTPSKWHDLFATNLANAQQIRERFFQLGISGITIPDDNPGLPALQFLKKVDNVVSLKNPPGLKQFKVFVDDIASDARGSSSAFAALLSTSRSYTGKRHLTLGTIVGFKKSAADAEPTYALCIQPVCDAVRLKIGKKAPFPFISLNKGPGKLVFCIETGADKFEIFGTTCKPRDLFREKFVSGEGQVVEAKRDGNDFKFTLNLTGEPGKSDGGYVECVFYGQLKPIQAQRVADRVSSMQSRVGLTESEWQRLLATSDE